MRLLCVFLGAVVALPGYAQKNCGSHQIIAQIDRAVTARPSVFLGTVAFADRIPGRQYEDLKVADLATQQIRTVSLLSNLNNRYYGVALAEKGLAAVGSSSPWARVLYFIWPGNDGVLATADDLHDTVIWDPNFSSYLGVAAVTHGAKTYLATTETFSGEAILCENDQTHGFNRNWACSRHRPTNGHPASGDRASLATFYAANPSVVFESHQFFPPKREIHVADSAGSRKMALPAGIEFSLYSSNGGQLAFQSHDPGTRMKQVVMSLALPQAPPVVEITVPFAGDDWWVHHVALSYPHAGFTALPVVIDVSPQQGGTHSVILTKPGAYASGDYLMVAPIGRDPDVDGRDIVYIVEVGGSKAIVHTACTTP